MSRGKGRQKWYCRRCDKTAFGSCSRATDAIGTIEANGPRRQSPKRAYPCPVGNGWHLTKEEARAS